MQIFWGMVKEEKHEKWGRRKNKKGKNEGNIQEIQGRKILEEVFWIKGKNEKRESRRNEEIKEGKS